jgi:WD40 repeat protein
VAPNGQTLAVGSWSDPVQIWKIATGELQRTLTGHPSGVGRGSIAFGQDGRLLAVGTGDGRLIFWRLPEGDSLYSTQAHADAVEGVVFAPDHLTLATGSLDGFTRLWRVVEYERRSG